MPQTRNTTYRRPREASFFDYSLLIAVIALCCFGLVMVYSASAYSCAIDPKVNDPAYYLKRQGEFMLLGFVAMVVVSRIDYHWYSRLAALGYAAAFLLMVLVDFVPGFGKESHGKKRWFMIAGRTLFQPSELVKVVVILCLAVFLYHIGKNLDKKFGKALLLLAAIVVPIDALVIINNLSTGLIILGIAFVMVFVASEKRMPFVVAVTLIAAAAFIATKGAKQLVDMGILQFYQAERILVWQDPWAYPLDGGFQVIQGLYAIGSGGLFGKGLGNSIQKLSFIPESQNDMIFSIICEELGVFGAVSVILLFFFLIWRLVVIANNAPDLLGSLLVVGIMAHISLQVVLNIAVVTNSIPNTGVTLPFISYGGTSILFLMVEMGMALGVSAQIRVETDV